MLIDRQYIVDDKNKKLAVQLSLETFEKMEEALENYALYQLMNEQDDDEVLSVSEAKEFYGNLIKKK
jgi:PHD/YefM family antitoxin component YafN of YafNO toxin-antitoxin module